MTTNISATEFLTSLDKWGVNWRFYKDRADWLTHNRNDARNNRVTPGGFGPLRGVIAHNTASTAQLGMIDYLYRGDAAGRALPGPLASTGILKTGQAVLLGWGTTNHCGPGDPQTDALVRKNAMPMDRDVRPTVTGPSDPRSVLLAPYYLGFEMCHGAEGPTAPQYRTAVLFTCACLDVMGGPANGYGAGSFAMHREFMRSRSDPQTITAVKFRGDVAAQLKAGPPSAPKPPTTPTPAPDWSDMATKDEFKQAIREVLAEPATLAKWWTGAEAQVVKDTRGGTDGSDRPRVTPSTLLEAAAKGVEAPAPVDPPTA